MLRTIATITLGTIATIAIVALCAAPIVSIVSIPAAEILLWASLACGLLSTLCMQWFDLA